MPAGTGARPRRPPTAHPALRPPHTPGVRAGRLERGDVILSIDGAVTESAKETTKYMKAGPRLLAVVVAGRDTGAPVSTPR